MVLLLFSSGVDVASGTAPATQTTTVSVTNYTNQQISDRLFQEMRPQLFASAGQTRSGLRALRQRANELAERIREHPDAELSQVLLSVFLSNQGRSSTDRTLLRAEVMQKIVDTHLRRIDDARFLYLARTLNKNSSLQRALDRMPPAPAVPIAPIITTPAVAPVQ